MLNMPLLKSHHVAVLATILLTGLAAACGGDSPTQPGAASVAGTYHAASFTMTESGVTRDLLNDGATVELVLNTDGTTSGTLFVPQGQDNGDDLQEDLSGTWTLHGSTVQLVESADTFLRDVQFQVQPNQLVADGTFGSSTVHLALQKQ